MSQHDDALKEWVNARPVGKEIIYDRFNPAYPEISKSDFLAWPSQALKSPTPVYVVNPNGGDWLVMSADQHYELLAKIEELTRQVVTAKMAKEEAE